MCSIQFPSKHNAMSSCHIFPDYISFNPTPITANERHAEKLLSRNPPTPDRESSRGGAKDVSSNPLLRTTTLFLLDTRRAERL